MANLGYPTNREEAYLYGFIDSGATVPEPVTRKEAYLEKIIERSRNIGELNITPEMFGAKGDGITDDLASFNEAITDNKILILSGSYYLDGDLILPAGTTLTGLNYSMATLKFSAGHGIVIGGRFVTIENINIEGDSTGAGISGGTNSEFHMVTVRNVIITGFTSGISTPKTTWDFTIENVRINNCGTGILTSTETNATVFGFTVINLYCNNCDKPLSLDGVKGTFIGSNFGIRHVGAVFIGTASMVRFIGCNFECDSQVTGSTAIMDLSSTMISFIDCGFRMNAEANVKMINCYSGLASLIFENCRYTSVTGNLMPDVNVFNKGSASTARYGAIVFRGSTSLPRPDFYNAQLPNWIDEENHKPIVFYGTTIDKTKLVFGAILYSWSQNCLCTYNGTNVVKVSDGSIVI